jgi:hypothetical protein
MPPYATAADMRAGDLATLTAANRYTDSQIIDANAGRRTRPMPTPEPATRRH